MIDPYRLTTAGGQIDGAELRRLAEAVRRLEATSMRPGQFLGTPGGPAFIPLVADETASGSGIPADCQLTYVSNVCLLPAGGGIKVEYRVWDPFTCKSGPGVCVDNPTDCCPAEVLCNFCSGTSPTLWTITSGAGGIWFGREYSFFVDAGGHGCGFQNPLDCFWGPVNPPAGTWSFVEIGHGFIYLVICTQSIGSKTYRVSYVGDTVDCCVPYTLDLLGPPDPNWPPTMTIDPNCDSGGSSGGVPGGHHHLDCMLPGAAGDDIARVQAGTAVAGGCSCVAFAAPISVFWDAVAQQWDTGGITALICGVPVGLAVGCLGVAGEFGVLISTSSGSAFVPVVVTGDPMSGVGGIPLGTMYSLGICNDTSTSAGNVVIS